MFPAEGDELVAPPTIIHMCFANPVNNKDLDKGGDFSFDVREPDGRRLGLRIVFQPDGYGLEVHPGLHEDTPEGEWTFEWRVTDAETLEPATGTVKFTVSADGDPLPAEPLSRCPAGGEEPTFATPTSTSVEDGGDGDDDQDIPLLALVTTGAVIVAAIVGLSLYLIRRRIGIRPHRPPEDPGNEGS